MKFVLAVSFENGSSGHRADVNGWSFRKDVSVFIGFVVDRRIAWIMTPTYSLAVYSMCYMYVLSVFLWTFSKLHSKFDGGKMVNRGFAPTTDETEREVTYLLWNFGIYASFVSWIQLKTWWKKAVNWVSSIDLEQLFKVALFWIL